MIDFNMLDRFDGPTRIGVFRALKKIPTQSFFIGHIESPSCQFTRPALCAHCPVKKVMSREMK